MSDTLEIQNADGPIGAAITGIDLSEAIDDSIFNRIEQALHERSVIVIRGQTLTPAQLADFSRRFGPLQVNVRAEANSDSSPEVFWVSNVMKDGKPLGSHDAGRYWHSDLCYLEKPSKVTLLNALEVPAKDGQTYGDTLFAGSIAAYDALSDEMKQRLDGLKAANGYRYMWNKKAHEFGKRPVLSEEELQKYPPDALHPIVRTHPDTGQKCLYICYGYTHSIVGMDKKESDTLLAELFDHVVDPAFVYRHKWQVGDLLIWDNCAVQHKATFDYDTSLRRVMQRCTVEGSVPY